MEDLPLKICWAQIVDFFSCPVCMCQLQETYVTPCGHRYCGKCIKECVDRHMKCPCCNKAIQRKDLIRDHQFDDLIGTAYDEKEKAEKEYFDALLNAAEGEVNHAVGNHRNSPVETVLKKHLKDSLAAHEKYHQDLKQELERRKNELKNEYTKLIESFAAEKLPPEEISRRKEALEGELNQQHEILQKDMYNCAELVAKAYDRYLTEHIPPLSILPVTVTLSLLNKNIQFPEVIIRPESSIDDIKGILTKEMETRGDKIVNFGDDAKFIYYGPFVRRSMFEMHRLAVDILEHNAVHPDIVILPAKCRPVLQYQAKTGGEIALYGKLCCESDLPKRCFASTFQLNQVFQVDYFSCITCGINWVCRSCMEVCHKDHEVAPYIMQHKPTWACCYCPKKKKVPTATLR